MSPISGISSGSIGPPGSLCSRGAGGLGRFLFLGLSTQDYAQMLAAAILVIALAIVVELVFEVIQRLSVRLVHARPHSKGM